MQHSATVVDYGAGNIGSVLNMLKKIGVAAGRGKTPDDILNARRIILPGVGAFGHCMQALQASGLIPALQSAVFEKKSPLLGICAGFQMMFDSSEEGSAPGLGWIKGNVVRFDPARLQPRQKIPHMGWSDVDVTRPGTLFAGMQDPRFYFVHSFHPQPADDADCIARCTYGYSFCCAAGRENISGVQFHPEKSHRFGMQLLRNFAGAAA